MRGIVVRGIVSGLLVWVCCECAARGWADGNECAQKMCVGVILPLSVHGEFGAAVRNGIELAQEEYSEQVRGLSFRYEDSAFDSKRAIGSLHKLAKVDGARVVYVLGGPLSEALAPLAERAGVVLLVSSIDPALAVRHRNVIRFANASADFGILLAKELLARKLLRVGVVITENPYMNLILEALRTSAGEQISFHEFHRGGAEVMDFRSIVTRIKGRIKHSRIDALAVMLHPGQISQFYRQLSEQQVSLQTFGCDALESSDEVRASGPAIRGAFFVNNKASESFRERYAKRFGNDTLLTFAAWGHDLALVLGRALTSRTDHPSSLSRQEIEDALSQDSEYEGAGGKIRFATSKQGDRYFKTPLMVKAVHE